MGALMKIIKKVKKPMAEERIPARCCVTKESFDILLGHEKGKLTMLRGERSYSVNVANIKRSICRMDFTLDEHITVRSAETKILFDAANASVLPVMTEKVHLPVPTVAILARYLEPWTVLKPMTAMV